MTRTKERGRRAAAPAQSPFDPSRPLLQLSPTDAFTIADACEGVQIFGSTGSGKTSGSGAALARAMLRAGFGGLVLTAKPDERALWERYCRETGRSESLIIFNTDSPHRFNFLDYELKRPGGGVTDNIVDLFTTAIAAARGSDQTSRQDPYWGLALEQLLRNAVDLLRHSTGSVSLPEMTEVIRSAARSPEQAEDEEKWQAESFCAQCLDKMLKGLTPDKAPPDIYETAAYWIREYPGLPDKTRASVVSTFTTMADGFLRGPIRELFCTTTSIVPELTHHGAVLLIDLPIKTHHRVGRFAQVIWKTLWQRATEVRDVAVNPRPVFLWADEAQSFATAKDADFQATARSSRACTVYLTQNISNYRAAMGGGRDAEASVDSFLGNLQTKVFHANGDAVTNEWASKTIANDWARHSSTSVGEQHDPKTGSPRPSASANTSESFDAQAPPVAFTMLSKGGRVNRGRVEAIVFQGGRVWKATGRNHIRVTFQQGGAA